MSRDSGSFWTTLPGILTGIGTLLGAVAGVIGVLWQAGLIGEHADSRPTAVVETDDDGVADPDAGDRPTNFLPAAGGGGTAAPRPGASGDDADKPAGPAEPAPAQPVDAAPGKATAPVEPAVTGVTGVAAGDVAGAVEAADGAEGDEATDEEIAGLLQGCAAGAWSPATSCSLRRRPALRRSCSA
jgi:hypothetical protein